MINHGAEAKASDARAGSFGYICNRCRKCCHDRLIQLNPYEIARLARNRGLTTGEFRAHFTEEAAGLFLQQTETGACIFLGRDGCTVHPDRPLVCRLYPLGRDVQDDGTESFSYVEPHPQSRGEFTRSGTIAEFLAVQGAEPYMRAADAYFFWVCAARERLGIFSDAVSQENCEQDEEIAHDLLDMDTAIAHHCAAMGLAEPFDLEERKKLHLTILYQNLEETAGEFHERTQYSPDKKLAK